MNKWSEILVGLIFVIIVILMVAYHYPNSWYLSAIALLKGGILWGLLGIGLILLLLGISELKD